MSGYVSSEAKRAAMPSERVVLMLIDEGMYLASESSFSQVLLATGRAKRLRAVRQPTAHIAAVARRSRC